MRTGLIATCSVLGVLFLVFAESAIIRELSHYFLALHYSTYIGLGLLALAGGLLLWQWTVPGRFGYLQHGIPAAVRVLQVDRFIRRMQGQMHLYFHVSVEYFHPEHGRIAQATLRSDHIVCTVDPARYSTSVGPGDYVTVIGFPGRFDKALKLYGFLRINPQLRFVLKDGLPIASYWVALSITLLLLGIGVLILGGIWEFSFGRFVVIGGSDAPWIIGASGGATIGLIMAILILWKYRSPHPRRRDRWATGAGVLLAGLMFGLIAGFFVTNSLNMWLDTSLSQTNDLEVLGMSQETSTPLYVRRYYVECRFFPYGTITKVPVRIDDIERYMETEAGIAEVRNGRFGMKWVRAIYPAVLVASDNTDPDDVVVATVESASKEREIKTVRLKPMIRLDDGSFREPSDALRRRIRGKLEQRPE